MTDSNITEHSVYVPHRRLNTIEALMLGMAITAGIVLAMEMISPTHSMVLLAFAGLTLLVCAIIFIRLTMRPEAVRAQQASTMLKLARQSFALINSGLDDEVASHLCRLLLPATTAIGVVMTDGTQPIGKAQREGKFPTVGMQAELIMEAASRCFAEGKTIVLTSPKDIDLSPYFTPLRAVIVVPVILRNKEMGAFLFYYRKARQANETQRSIADGFGALVSTEIAASALEEQTQLASEMRLKALQNQINPHFLFNTINTIASLIRTDPMTARNLLREFAVFYRQTLESDNLILLSKEAEQTYRYFMFEVARFGEERVELILNEDEDVEDMMVPPFLLQPLVENAVRHAMPAEGKLTVTIHANIDPETNNLVITVHDNGVGMTKEACDNIMHPESSTGCGIAVKNVHDRIKGYFGSDSKMIVESELGVGTTVTLILVRRPEEIEE